MGSLRKTPALSIFTLAVCAVALLGTASPSPGPVPSGNRTPPSIASLMRPEQFKKILDDRDIVSLANLEDEDAKGVRHYSFMSAMVAHAGIDATRQILTDYSLYAKLVPYIDHAIYTPETQTLELAGGIWAFKLLSWIRFEQYGDRWIHYRVVRGHFTGLEGDLYFESVGEKGTAVLIQGAVSGTVWPPKFVIERGAEIVFEFTARRMRSSIESLKSKLGETHDPEVPQPRHRL